MPYHLIYSGWMVLGCMADHRPHNPSVPGSSPGCPILSTPIQKLVFVHYATNAETFFYADFTHSTKRERSNWQQRLASQPVICSLPATSLNPPNFYQNFLQVRKKCVKLCLSLPLALESKVFVYLKTRDWTSLVLKYFLVC